MSAVRMLRDEAFEDNDDPLIRFPAEAMDLLLEVLRVDPPYQRPLDRALVRHIADHFDPRYFGRIVVVERANGELAVVDGQHRVQALRAMGVRGALVPCDVHRGLPLMAEAALFRRPQERAGRRPLRAEDIFRAALIEGDEESHAIKQIVEAHGFVLDLDSHSKAEGGMRAVASLQRIFREGGAEGLDAVLGLVRDAFGLTPEANKATLLQGLWRFHRKYRAVYSRKLLVQVLRKASPQGVVADGRKVSDALRMSSPDGVARAIFALYNKGRSRNALPEWSDYRAPGHSRGRRVLDPGAEVDL